MDAKIMEIEGKSIDEAIEKACREFGVAREKLNIEIISEETGGFLGMLSKKAKIKASLLSLDMEFSLADTSSEPQKEEVKTEIKEAKKEVKEIKRETKKELAAKIKITAETSKPAPQEPTALGVRAKEILEGILQRM